MDLMEALQEKGFEESKMDYKEEALRKLPGIKLERFEQSIMKEVTIRVKTKLSEGELEELIYEDLSYWFDGDDGSRIIEMNQIKDGFYVVILLG